MLTITMLATLQCRLRFIYRAWKVILLSKSIWSVIALLFGVCLDGRLGEGPPKPPSGCYNRLLLNGGLTNGGLVWGPFRFSVGPGPGPGPAQILAWVQARAHSLDIKCLSIIFNFLKKRSPH